MTVKLQVGDSAPEFTLPATGGTVSLAQTLSEADRGVIIYFFPRAMTPGCTKQACDFRDSLDALVGEGYRVIGISPDSLERQDRFADKESVNFPLASDEDKSVMRAYGAYGMKMNYGKEVEGVIRSTFVVNKKGILDYVGYNVKATGHVARLRRELGIDA
ncbi:peroxiredoxin [Trueperella sp. LYQ143]|uniref:peroxiredoxin n=1 Tax=unclassified Trueperella TaxID=2630174 RepID=UPI0039838E36